MAARKTAIICALVVWLSVVGIGTRELLRYGNTPGAPASPPSRWPAAVGVALAENRFTMLVFAHPQCPCSRASIGELSRIIASHGDRVEVTVLFFSPSSLPAAWTKGDLWRSAAAIPGVRVWADREGSAARAFGARTSGEVLLYDTAGRLRFQGGITASRGQSGDNAGRGVVEALLHGQVTGARTARVFGCALGG
jgi:hypothetical protein